MTRNCLASYLYISQEINVIFACADLIFPFYYVSTFWLMAAALDELRKTEHTIHTTIDGVFPINVQTKEKLMELYSFNVAHCWMAILSISFFFIYFFLSFL
jgi:hypothetical protein